MENTVNGKSTEGFPSRYRLTLYVTPKFPQTGSNYTFFTSTSNKFQWQSCSAFISLSSDINTLVSGDPITVKFGCPWNCILVDSIFSSRTLVDLIEIRDAKCTNSRKISLYCSERQLYLLVTQCRHRHLKPACDGQTDGQITTARTVLCIKTAKTNTWDMAVGDILHGYNVSSTC